MTLPDEQELAALAITDSDALGYFRFHQERYGWLLRTLEPLLKSPVRVLDIGLSALPRLLLGRFPGVRMTTLGFPDARYHRPGEWPHLECDLNDPAFDWEAAGRQDVVILAEVIEHLYSPPHRLLAALAGVLAPGGLLVIQTPNAASLEKRLKLAAGRNPYAMIRDNPRDPSHFREYTVAELRQLATETGYSVAAISVRNYFRPASLPGRVNRILGAFLPATLRDGITIVLKRC